jgi:Asp/Glu/hydantoin racemase
MSQATAKLQGMLQGVNVTDAVIANVQITAALLAATLLDIKD